MRTRRQGLLILLAVSFLVVGVHALVAPASFHDSFPLGRAWIALDGPYNEHLVRDVGAANTAFGVLALLAVRHDALVRPVAITVLVLAIPHLAYHATHMEPFTVTDVIWQLVALSIQVVVPVLLLGPRQATS